MRDDYQIKEFFDIWAERCQETGTVAMRIAPIMRLYGGFGNLTVAEEQEAFDDIRKQCEDRGLEIISFTGHLLTRVRRSHD